MPVRGTRSGCSRDPPVRTPNPFLTLTRTLHLYQLLGKYKDIIYFSAGSHFAQGFCGRFLGSQITKVGRFRGRFLWKVFAEGFAEGFCSKTIFFCGRFRGRFLRKVLQKVLRKVFAEGFAEGFSQWYATFAEGFCGRCLRKVLRKVRGRFFDF